LAPWRLGGIRTIMSKNFAIIVGEFHKDEAEEMVAEARATIESAGHKVVDVIWVPGSYEVPLALKRQLLRDDVDGAIVLGIIERGETAHGLVMGHTVSDAIINLQLETMKPVGIGLLGPEIVPSQIPSRVVPYAIAAAKAALKMAVQ